MHRCDRCDHRDQLDRQPAAPRRLRAHALPLLLGALLLPALAGAQEDAAPPLRRWGFGWDPADSGSGLTVRHRFSPRWDLSVAAGPNDYRLDSESRGWDDDSIDIEDGMPERDDDRREQGWVRLVAGGCFWRDGRVSVSGVGAVTYRWSVEEYSYRNFDNYSGSQWDYRNSREKHDVDDWTVALGVRPSLAVTPRLNVEFEAGLEFERITTERETRRWWDNYPETSLQQESRHQRMFSTYGGFEFYRLKFIFWF